MKRALLWLLMVLVFTALVLGGALGFFYYSTDADDLPASGVTFAGQLLTMPAGFDWKLPVLGGVLWREFSLSPILPSLELEPITTPSAALELSEDMTAGGTTLLLKTAGGVTVFDGTASEWKDFTFPQNGEYYLTIRAGRQASGQKPAKPVGYYQYQCRFWVDVQPTLTLPSGQAAQGDVAAIYVSGALGAGGAPPTAQCELGPVWFRPTQNGWLGYLPVAYNAEGGEWPITVTLDDATLSATITVRSTEYPSVQASPGEAATAGANEEFRRVIWSLYGQGSNEALWTGAFQYPAQGASIFQSYGAYLYDGETSAGRAANLTLLTPENALAVSPAAGRVAYAGNLQLTGSTVVIDHGCGMKSYLFGLSSIAGIKTGDEVAAGQGLGVAGRKLIWEVRIGNKSVDPQKLTRGGSNGLFYRPVGDELR
ncbi:MAG TPA: M23 family metallopeptidase [Candidatus Fournierella excrementigallinarum]|nr:M23 family metallopeptidase [Candidatus Fournierella excrementigallinarum]